MERTTRRPSAGSDERSTSPRASSAPSVAPIDCALICSSRASALGVAGPPRSSRASAELCGSVSSPSACTWRSRRSSRPMLTRRAAATCSVSVAGCVVVRHEAKSRLISPALAVNRGTIRRLYGPTMARGRSASPGGGLGPGLYWRPAKRGTEPFPRGSEQGGRRLRGAGEPARRSHRAADRRERRARRARARDAPHTVRHGPRGRGARDPGGRAGGGQDHARQGALALDRLPLLARAVHARPAAERRHGRVGLRPAHERLRVPPGPRLHEPAAGGRGQPRVAEDAGGAARVACRSGRSPSTA